MRANIPNILCYFRLSVVPFFIAAFLWHQYGVALLLFFLAGSTDLVDGYLARKLNQRTRFGAILDPAADKLLMVSTYVCLATVDVIPWWFVIIMLCKDLFIVGGISFFWASKIPFEYKPVFWSKATTLFLIVVGTLGLIELVFPHAAFFMYPLSDFLFGGIYITGVLIVVTILEYLRAGLEILQTR